MDNRWCTACGAAFLPRAQAPHQSYCAEPACQRERRRLWQKAKRRSDPDYLENQIQAQRAWVERNPDYWAAYREKNPGYTAQNRADQRGRNAKRRTSKIAKMDASPAAPVLDAGIYELRPLDKETFAKMGVWTVQLTVLSASSA